MEHHRFRVIPRCRSHSGPASETSQTTWPERDTPCANCFLLPLPCSLCLPRQAANTSTTAQLGVVSSSSVTQNGLTNDSSSTTQVGILNGASTMQGTSSPSLNNASTVN